VQWCWHITNAQLRDQLNDNYRLHVFALAHLPQQLACLDLAYLLATMLSMFPLSCQMEHLRQLRFLQR
jgi:hypothetical protein